MFFHICPECDHRNPQGSRFCNSCGAPLQRRFCRNCGAANDVQSPACRACGASLPVITTADESLFAAPAPEPSTRGAPPEACAPAPAATTQPSTIASLYPRAEERSAIDATARVDDAATQIRLPAETVAAAALPVVVERDDLIDYPAPARRRGRRAAVGFLVLVLAAVVAAFYPTRQPASPEPFSGSINTDTPPAPAAATAVLPAPSPSHSPAPPPAATPSESTPKAASAAGATAAANEAVAAPPQAEPTARRVAPSPPPARAVQRPPTPQPCTPALAALALCELEAEPAGR
jgi:hypothetical protein